MPDDAKAISNTAFSAGRSDESARYFSDAIALAPENYVLYSNRSAAYASLGRYSDALADAKRTVALRPDWAKGYSRLGAARLGLGDAPGAVEAYEKGLALDLSNEALKSGLAQARQAASASRLPEGSGADAIGKVFQGPELWSNVAADPTTRGYLDQPDFVQMLREVQRNPSSLNTYLSDQRMVQVLTLMLNINLQHKSNGARKAAAQKEKEAGNAAYKEEDFDTAIQHYTKAMELDDEDICYITNRAAVYLEMGKYDECIKDCDKAVERGRELCADFKMISRALTRKGTALAKLAKSSKDYDVAIETFQKALTEHRNPDTLKKLNEAEQAKKELEQQEYYDPKIADEEREKGNEFFKQQKYPEAVQHYTEALRRNPKDPRVNSNRAACYTKMGALPEGLKDAEKCIELDPTFSKGYARKGAIQFFMKEYDKALETYQAVLKHDPKNQELLDGVRRCVEQINKAARGELSEEELKERQNKAMQDPEIQNILTDPIMPQNKAMQDPEIQNILTDPIMPQLEGARRASIEKNYIAALREAENRCTGRRTKPTAHWPDGVMKVFQMIYMTTCRTKGVRFKRGEKNWVDNPIVHDMALELFARTQRAYSGQQLHNKWKNMKLDRIFKEDQKLDIEGPKLPPPVSTPPPQHLGFTVTANGIEIDTSQPPIVFKSQLYTLTGVPPECQKIIGKGGTLEDNRNWSDLGVKDGQKLMMIGTNATITKVLQEEVDTLVIAAANNPSTRELSKSLQLPTIEFLLEENGHNSDVEILTKEIEHLDIENNKDKEEIAILKEKLVQEMKEKMGYINEVDLLKNQLYKADALRSDMHNQLMELMGSIRVFCRVRPILDKSNSEDSAVYCLEKGQFVGRRVYLETSSGVMKAFTCDRVFPPGVSQNDIFVEISGLVKSAIDGKKVCIFAYGQTGSGKTFTMLGDDGDNAKGVIPRAVEEIFETIQIRESSGLALYTVKIGMSEIYNDKVRNLSSMASKDSVVETKTQALGALKEALSKRAVAKTSRNDRSSRSHFIFRLSICSKNEKMEMCEGALNIIDLAGSEAADSDATKEVQAEATAINKSLLHLGTTIGQIERGAEFINFRNSQLTRELQSSLGKNCKVLMFVNVASEKTYAKETNATFEFAAHIKSSIKMETLDSKKTQLLKEKEFEFKSPGMSSVWPQKGAFGLNPPFSISIRRTTKQGPSCTKKFDVVPASKKRKLYNND